MGTRQPDLFDRVWAAFAEALAAPIGESWRAAGAALALFAVFPALLWAAPVLYLNDMALDVFIPLDGAWRMAHGQWPHLDFHTPIGALYYVLLDVVGPGPKAPLLVGLVVLPVSAGAAFVLTRDRLPTPLRLALVGAVAFLTISPRTLDAGLLVSHLASYNRHGWTFAVVAATGALLAPKSRTRFELGLEIALLTLCTVAAFYLKITFFALIGGVFGVVALAGGPNRWLALGAGLASLAAVGAGFAVGPTNAAYLADLAHAARASAGGPGLVRTDRLASIFQHNQAELFGLAALWIALIRTARTDAEQRAATREILPLAAVAALSVVITSQSHDHAMPVLLALWAATFAAWRRRWRVRGDAPTGMRLAGAAAMASLGLSMARDAGAILRHTAGAFSAHTAPLADIEGSPVTRIRVPASPPGPSLLDRVIDGTLPPDAYDNLGPDWARDDGVILADAVALLRRHGLADRRIASLTFSPCFPWILGSQPPRHLPAWLDYQRTFSAADAAEASRTLADSEVVLVPVVWRIEGVLDAYGPALERDFALRDRTALWSLYVRR